MPQRPHSSLHTTTYSRSTRRAVSHTAAAASSTILACGTVAAADFRTFSGLVRGEAECRRGQAANEKGSEGKGFHRTPALIHTAALDVQAAAARKGGLRALAAAAAADRHPVQKSMPRGGFTDVGQHTGTVPPNTAWPLVRETFKVGRHISLGGAELACRQVRVRVAWVRRWSVKYGRHM